MSLDSIEDAIAAVAAGECVIVVDDEDRENEGDVVMAASQVTKESMAFIIKAVCAALKKFPEFNSSITGVLNFEPLPNRSATTVAHNQHLPRPRPLDVGRLQAERLPSLPFAQALAEFASWNTVLARVAKHIYEASADPRIAGSPSRVFLVNAKPCTQANLALDDTDGDDLYDGEEVNDFSTDPIDEDTDRDGLTDGDEVRVYKTNPLTKDTDNDGLSDGDEVNRHSTDPKNADTDGDGLRDGSEVNKHKTRPTEVDTDKDGLSDGDEVNRHKTNPNNTDTDAGGVNDGAEIARNINPLDPSDDVTVRETTTIVEREVETRTVFDRDKPLVLEDVFFNTGKWDILPESEVELSKVLVSLRDDNPDVKVEISGHTDNVGSDENNQKLSLNRAQSVKAWFVAKGIADNRITTKGYGEAQPRATNDTPEGRKQNRRIEMRRIN